MVKNYLVSAVRPIRSGWHIEKNKSLYANYQKMYSMSLASFREFVMEPFDEICWTDDVDDNDQYTIENWRAIRDLWHSEPCNIFWAGADTLMTQPTSLFGDRFPEYRLFNFTDPRTHRHFQYYFNDDIQYYPHTMSAEIWNLGEKLWEQRDTDPDRYWGFDQNRHNTMFWTQDIAVTDRLHPEMAWQAMHLRSMDPNMINWHAHWNQLAFEQAHILHFHASRGSQAVINLMQDLCEKLDVRT
jgi:hypothetical protein